MVTKEKLNEMLAAAEQQRNQAIGAISAIKYLLSLDEGKETESELATNEDTGPDEGG